MIDGMKNPYELTDREAFLVFSILPMFVCFAVIVSANSLAGILVGLSVQSALGFGGIRLHLHADQRWRQRRLRTLEVLATPNK